MVLTVAKATIVQGESTKRGYSSYSNPETQSISAYLEHMDLFFSAKNVLDEKKVPMLLSLVGPKIHDLLCGLFSPVMPKDKTYN